MYTYYVCIDSGAAMTTHTTPAGQERDTGWKRWCGASLAVSAGGARAGSGSDEIIAIGCPRLGGGGGGGVF